MNRKRKQQMLASVLDQSSYNDDESSAGSKKILFQNGEIPLVLNKQASNFYSVGRCDYDEYLIGSPDWWHQIFVSLSLNSHHNSNIK